MAYTFGTTVDGDLDHVRDKVTTALAEQGFGVLTTIDVAATLKAKLDVDTDPYVILGACNPPFAHRALQHDPEIGALLPCNVVLRQDGARVHVRFMDPEAVLGLVEGVDEIAAEVKARLEMVAAAIDV